MNFSELPPSKQWSPLNYQGETLAEVWFKPEGEPFALVFRIPQQSFHIPGIGPRLTTENLLKSVGIAAQEVEFWKYDSEGSGVTNGTHSELQAPLPIPPDVACLNIYVRMKPPLDALAHDSTELEVRPVNWQNLETRWNAILVAEVTIDTLRLKMESLRSELEASANKSLTGDEKLHASNADVAQWNKAKSRVRYALPKVKEFIHRATWAMGAPERKKLEELYQNNIRRRIPFPQADKVQEELEFLFKDRQILSAHGVTVSQECKSCCTDCQGALRTLQSNAASNAQKKRVANRAKGKSF